MVCNVTCDVLEETINVVREYFEVGWDAILL